MLTMCERTLGGLIGEGGLEMVTTGDEGGLLRIESDEGLLDGLDAVSGVATACVVQLVQLLLLSLDILSDGGNICVQLVQASFQWSLCHGSEGPDLPKGRSKG